MRKYVKQTYRGKPTGRNKVFAYLSNRNDKYYSSVAIGDILGMDPSTVASHLTTLRREGSVTSRRASPNGPLLEHRAIRKFRPGSRKKPIQIVKAKPVEIRPSGTPATHTGPILDKLISAMAELEQKVQTLEAENKAYKSAINMIKGIVTGKMD